jgi:hypothetical protein
VNECSPSPQEPPIDLLRAGAARQGVVVEDEDLDGVLEFLDVVLPRLAEIERRLPPETPA